MTWSPTVQNQEVEINYETTGAGTAWITAEAEITIDRPVEEVYDFPERIEWRGSNEMADFDGFYQLTQAPDSTHVKMVSKLDVHGPMKLPSPVMAVMSRVNARKQFDRLKELLEDRR